MNGRKKHKEPKTPGRQTSQLSPSSSPRGPHTKPVGLPSTGVKAITPYPQPLAPPASIKFVVWGQPVSQNACYQRSKQGRMFMTKEGSAWKQAVAICGKLAMSFREPLTGPVRVTYRPYFQSMRNDLDGVLKPTQDALQGAVIENDRQVREIHMYHGLDRQKPRVEIEIEEIR